MAERPPRRLMVIGPPQGAPRRSRPRAQGCDFTAATDEGADKQEIAIGPPRWPRPRARRLVRLTRAAWKASALASLMAERPPRRLMVIGPPRGAPRRSRPRAQRCDFTAAADEGADKQEIAIGPPRWPRPRARRLVQLTRAVRKASALVGMLADRPPRRLKVIGPPRWAQPRARKLGRLT